MTIEREFLKRAILGLLDAVADEHSLGHQESKAARYVLASKDRTSVEIMFEKNSRSPPNIWCHEKAAGKALISAHRPKRSPPRAPATKGGKAGSPSYGRHSALEKMQQLGDADFVCFAPTTIAQAGEIIDRLHCVTPSDMS